MTCLLYQNDNIIGVFESYQKAEDMAKGIINNGWAKNFSIVEYKINTCLKVRESKVDAEIEEESEYETESDSDDENKLSESQLQSKLNLLKMQKERIEESKTKYEIDLKLYNEFKEKLETDNEFVIPELFIEKYKIFHQLDQEENISWESFSLLHKESDYLGNFANVFQINNAFETKFLQNIDSDTESSVEEKEEESSVEEDSEDSNSMIEIIQVVNSSEESQTED
jgi:hypothetical protein